MPVVSVPPRGVGGRRPGGRSLVVRAAACLALVIAASAGAAEPAPSVAARAAYASAAALQNRGAWDLAAQEWQALLRDHPADVLVAKARYQLGICRAKLGDWPAAAEAFRGVVTQAGADAETVALARFEWAKGTLVAAQATAVPADYGAAAALLGETVAAGVPPGLDTEARWYLGEARWQAGDREGALAAWREAAAPIPDSRAAATPRLADVLHSLGVAEAEAGDGSAALATLGRFAKLFPAHPLAADVALRRADLLVADDPRAAEKLLLPLASGPRADAALERIGAARWKAADWKGAAEAYGRLADRHADSPLAARGGLLAARALAAAGDTGAARARLTKLVGSGAPIALEAAAELSRVELAEGRAAEALAAAERGLGLAAGVPSAAPAGVAALHLARADALWELPDRRADAEAAYRKVVGDHPGDGAAASARAVLALAALEAGRTAEALAETDALLAAAPAGDPLRIDVAAIRAEALLASGDTAAAATAFARLAEDHPADARTGAWLVRQAAALGAGGDWKAARDQLARALPALDQTRPGPEARAEALLLEATAAVELGQPRDALVILERLARAVPPGTRAVDRDLLAIRARLDGGDAAGGLELAERLAAGRVPEGSREQVAFRLGQARMAAGRAEEALEAFAEVVRLAPQGPRAAPSLSSSGWCHERAGRLPEAIAAWTAAIERYPASSAATSALLARSDARARSGDPAAGLADAERLLAAHGDGSRPLEPRSLGEARLVAATCLTAVGRAGEALALLDRLVADDPGFPAGDRVCWERGLAALAAGDPTAAEESFTRLVDTFPRSPLVAAAWLERGEIAFLGERPDAAAAAYEKALAAAPLAGAAIAEQARHKLGWVHALRGDHAAAAAQFTRQIAAAPQGPWAVDGRALLGQSLFALGRVDEARKALAEALAEPERISSDGLRAVTLLRAAEAAARQDAWQDSLDLAERARAALPDAESAGGTAAQAAYAAAAARQQLGQLAAAREGFRALADAATTPLAARARLMEGEVLFEEGRHDEAIRSFFKVAYGTAEGADYRPWQGQALFEAARCFEVLRQPDQARKLYGELVEKHPDSPQLAAARKRLAALGAATAAPGRDEEKR